MITTIILIDDHVIHRKRKGGQLKSLAQRVPEDRFSVPGTNGVRTDCITGAGML